MEFTISPEAEVVFLATSETVGAEPPFIYRNMSKWLRADVQATNHCVKDSDNFSWRLKHLLNKNPWDSNNQDKTLDWRFGFQISMANLNEQPESGNQANFSGIKIYSRSSFDFLGCLRIFNEKLKTESPIDDVCFNVYVSQFGPSENTNDLISFKAKGLKIEHYSANRTQSEIKFEQLVIPELLMLKWKRGLKFSAFLRLTCQLSDKAIARLYEMTEGSVAKYWPMKSMLRNELCTDLVISVGQDTHQVSIKCHRSFLVSQSKVFERMLTTGMMESTEKKIFMEKNTEDGIRAVLGFLYYKDIEPIGKNSCIAFEVLELAEIYEIEELWEMTRDIFLLKNDSWFEPGVALSMYSYIKCALDENMDLADKGSDDEDSDDKEGDVDMNIPLNNGPMSDKVRFQIKKLQWNCLKRKCLNVLRWYFKTKPKTLYNCDTLKELLRDNPQMLLQITSAVM